MTVTATRIAITPTGGALGAIVTGLDTSRPVAPSEILQLKQAWQDYHLLIFKDQTLTEEQLLAFANYFGDIFQQPAYIPKGKSETVLPPLVLTLSNASYEESSVNLRPGNIELLPHIDHNWFAAPSSGSLLFAVEIPEGSPNTYWVNLVQAYEELDEATKKQIANLQVLHYNPFTKLHKGNIPSASYGPGRELEPGEKVIAHPLVRTHPDSGKKILYLNAANEVEIVDYGSTSNNQNLPTNIIGQKATFYIGIIKQPRIFAQNLMRMQHEF